MKVEDAKRLVRDAIAAGIFNDLVSESLVEWVQLCQTEPAASNLIIESLSKDVFEQCSSTGSVRYFPLCYTLTLPNVYL